MKGSKQITRTSLFSTARCGYVRNTIRPTAYGKRWYSQTNNTSRPAFAYMFNTFRRNKFVGAASFGSVLAFGTFYCAEKEKAKHSQHRCDGCGMYPISGARYHCVQCKNYDLCESCIEKRSSIHNPSHSFKEFDIIPERAYERPGSSRRYRDERDLRKQDEDRHTAERFGRTNLNNRSYGNFARNAYEDYEQHPYRERWNRPFESYTGDDESLKWGYGTPRRNVDVRDDYRQGREEGVYPRKQRYDPGINRRNDMTLQEKQNTRVQPKPRRNEMDLRPSGYDSHDRDYQKRMLENERQAGQGDNISEKEADSYTDHLRRQQGYMNTRGTFPGQEEEVRRFEVERGREAARPLVQQIKRGPGMHDKYDKSDKYWQSKKGRKELKKEEKERRKDSDWPEGKGRLIGAMH